MKTKRMLASVLAAVSIFTCTAISASAETPDGLKNGLVNGYSQGMKNGLTNGFTNGYVNGYAEGLKTVGETDW